MTFYRGDTFAIEGMYGETNALPEGTNRLLTQLTVSGFPDRVTEVVKVKVKLRLDPSGLLICTRAHFSEEVTYQEEVDAAEAAAAAADGGDATGDVAPVRSSIVARFIESVGTVLRPLLKCELCSSSR